MDVYKGSLWILASGVQLLFQFNPSETRGTVLVNKFVEGTMMEPAPDVDEEEPPVPLPLFYAGDDVVGDVLLQARVGETFEYTSCNIDLIGELYFRHDLSERTKVCSWSCNVESEGEHSVGEKKRKLPFRFHRVCVGHESYHGKHIQLRYYVQITLHRKWLPAVIHTQDVWMMSPRLPEPVETLYNIRMEVGIERLLHLEMEYSRSVYFTDECILGKVYFLDLHANLKNMMICLQRKEVLNIGSGCHAESENLFLFEFMDGAPAAGECIPLRLDLKALPYLTPTYKNALGKFSVVYVLNLILVDEEDKKYFKTQEITLCRRPLVCAPTTAL